MKIHLRHNWSSQLHTHFTVFIDGRNCGNLCMSPDEALIFVLVFNRGTDDTIVEFVNDIFPKLSEQEDKLEM